MDTSSIGGGGGDTLPFNDSGLPYNWMEQQKKEAIIID